MQIVLVSNFANHYLIPFADELAKLTNNCFTFIETQPLPDSFKKSGFREYNRNYIVQGWQDKEKAMSLCRQADVMIAGGGKSALPYERIRLKEKGIILEYSERVLKRGWPNLFSPTNVLSQFFYHLFLYNKPAYKLCASAFAANDLYLQHSFVDKCFKFGYFPQIPSSNRNSSWESDTPKGSKIKIIWCGRFIKWKHPEMVLLLAKRLTEMGCDFEINMIGSGVLYEKIKSRVSESGLSEVVHLLGNFPNNKVLELMSEHHIFLFTSDKNEGWGVVLNEAMGQGCCPVASHMIGSVPYLIEDKVNGRIFESGNSDSLVDCVYSLISNVSEIKRMGQNAYDTMRNTWNPREAAVRLIKISEELLRGNYFTYNNGPLSKASPISQKY